MQLASFKEFRELAKWKYFSDLIQMRSNCPKQQYAIPLAYNISIHILDIFVGNILFSLFIYENVINICTNNWSIVGVWQKYDGVFDSLAFLNIFGGQLNTQREYTKVRKKG